MNITQLLRQTYNLNCISPRAVNDWPSLLLAVSSDHQCCEHSKQEEHHEEYYSTDHNPTECPIGELCCLMRASCIDDS